jgi:hypothetical protein
MALTGCTPTSIGTVSNAPVPEEILEGDVDGPWAYAADGALMLGLSGSSSCPSVPTAMETTGAGVLTVTLESGFAVFCTADLQLVVHELQVDQIPDQVVLMSDGTATSLDVALD